MTKDEVRSVINSVADKKDVKALNGYLTSIGDIRRLPSGDFSVVADLEEKIKTLAEKIEAGDIVFSSQYGVMLVIDTKPAANPDGKHYRSLKLSLDENGKYMIIEGVRSIIVDDACTFKMRASKFPVKDIERMSFERFKAYNTIHDIDTRLTQIRES